MTEAGPSSQTPFAAESRVLDYRQPRGEAPRLPRPLAAGGVLGLTAAVMAWVWAGIALAASGRLEVAVILLVIAAGFAAVALIAGVFGLLERGTGRGTPLLGLLLGAGLFVFMCAGGLPGTGAGFSWKVDSPARGTPANAGRRGPVMPQPFKPPGPPIDDGQDDKD